MTIALLEDAPLPTWVAAPVSPGLNVHLYLHGSGERGENADRLSRRSLPGLIRQGLGVPFSVVAPICPHDRDWSEQDLVSAALRCLQTAACNAENPKFSISGYSMGARGVWIALMQEPQFFDRAMVVAGRVAADFPANASIAAQIRVIHGELDDHETAANMRAYCKSAAHAGLRIEYEEIPGKGHFISDAIYARRDVIEWFSV